MNHYPGMEHYLIKERNEQIGREVQSIRLEGQLRGDHVQKKSLSRLVTLAFRSTLPLLHRMRLAER